MFPGSQSSYRSLQTLSYWALKKLSDEEELFLLFIEGTRTRHRLSSGDGAARSAVPLHSRSPLIGGPMCATNIYIYKAAPPKTEIVSSASKNGDRTYDLRHISDDAIRRYWAALQASAFFALVGDT